MEFKTVIQKRYSYRHPFSDQLVDEAALRRIAEAAFLAPSGCNLQTPRILAVSDPDILVDLGRIYGARWAETAKAAILLFADPSIVMPGKGNRYIEDFAAAAEHVYLAMTDEGLAGVWIQGQIEGEKAKQMAVRVGIPDEYIVLGYFPMGYPTKDVTPVPKQSFESRCFLNQFGQSF